MKELINILNELKNNNVFLTGGGGVGKSYNTKNIIYHYQRQNKNVVILGSTGIASSNIGGQTLHSFFKIGFSNNINEYNKFLNTSKSQIRLGIIKKLKQTIPYIDLLIIDEISMVSGPLLDLIVFLLELYKFKGRILVVGDFYQLPPVTKNGQVKNFAFESNSWKNKLKFKIIELKKIYRTKDIQFIRVLNNIRKGKIQKEDINYLKNLQKNKSNVKNNIPTILAGTNKVAKNYNNIQLNKLKASEHIYKWILRYNINCKNPEEEIQWNKKYKKKIFNFCDSLLIEKELKLKVGCSIIFLTNGDRWYNGEKGRIIEIKETLKERDETDILYSYNNKEYVEEIIVVEKINGELIELNKSKWEFVEYEGQDSNIKKKLICEVWQYPIKLAYSITIHKSQGMSIDNLICDINNIFEEHQFYVSISRAINPNNLYLHYVKNNLEKHLKNITIVNEKVKRFYKNE